MLHIGRKGLPYAGFVGEFCDQVLYGAYTFEGASKNAVSPVAAYLKAPILSS